MPHTPQAQLNALLAVTHQLPALVKELRKANRLKALELKIKIQNDWRPSTNMLGEIDDIVEG